MLLLNEAYDHLDEYLESTNSKEHFKEDLNNLAARSFVSYTPSNITDYKSIVVSPLFMRVVAKYDDFEQLYAMYPVSVTRPDGSVDYLRKDRMLCSKIYSIVVKGNKDSHDHIMRCLNSELNYRKSSGTMKYMKRLSKWLSQREWENFEDVIDDAPRQITESYGTTLE